jgi:hypothetical protein
MSLNTGTIVSEKICNLLESMIIDDNLKKISFPVYSGIRSRAKSMIRKAHKKSAKPESPDGEKMQHQKKYDPLDNVGLCVSLPNVSEMDDGLDMGEMMDYLDETFFHGQLKNSEDDEHLRMLFDNYVILPGICMKFGVCIQDMVKKVMNEFPEYMTVDFLRDVVKPWYRHEITERKLRISGKMPDGAVYSEIQHHLPRLFPEPEKLPRGRRSLLRIAAKKRKE